LNGAVSLYRLAGKVVPLSPGLPREVLTLSLPKVVAQIFRDFDTTGCMITCPVAALTADMAANGQWKSSSCGLTRGQLAGSNRS
jgi:hypothetical protein